jgi:hypothetical protein
VSEGAARQTTPKDQTALPRNRLCHPGKWQEVGCNIIVSNCIRGVVACVVVSQQLG